MSWWHEFADSVELDAPLGPLTWFRVGGRAEMLCRPHSVNALAEIVRRAREQDVPVRILGAGANVLVSDDGVDGVVVRLDSAAFREVRSEGDALRVGAGVDLIPFARRCSRSGLSGLECMAGIPASIGGAVRMNAGGRFGEIKDVVREVEVLTAEGHRQCWPAERVGFGYRHTNLRDEIVLSATVELRRDDPERVSGRFDECHAYKQKSQPLSQQSAGCIFRNPPGASAGALIDQAGLKGRNCGGARVSEIHANFIVAEPDTRVADILRLIELIREQVRRCFSVELQPEVEIWGKRNLAVC
ncbi:MAG: UDP-N-acetylmuramate dehydrogenase [Phycisphaerae bacterium]|nr:UDP-N-acetylmuramate dehydrogenase [Phycisphaerae bacterium]